MTTQPENHQDPQTNDTKKKDTKPLWYMLAIAAVCIFAFSLYVIFNSGTKHNADPAPTQSNNVVYNQDAPSPAQQETTAPTTTPTTQHHIGGDTNGNVTYPEVAPDVIKLCKAWATANQGKDAMLKNIQPYVTDEVYQGLTLVNPHNTAKDGPTLTNITINKAPHTDNTYTGYCTYNKEPMPRYGGTFTTTDGTTYKLSEPNDPRYDRNVLPDTRPEEQRTSQYDLNQ